MDNQLVLAVVLILVGTALLARGHFSYRTRETALEIGPIKPTAAKTPNVPIPAILGWALIGGGTVVLVLSSRPKT
jgi:uncharacterized membrane protein YidH (DUF202 family)